MKRGSIWAVAVAGLLVGCATLKAPLESRGEERFEQALGALTRGDYRTAHEGFSWVAQNDDDEDGQRALLILAALELDPRNPERRIAAGADVAASYLSLGEKPVWTNPEGDFEADRLRVEEALNKLCTQIDLETGNPE